MNDLKGMINLKIIIRLEGFIKQRFNSFKNIIYLAKWYVLIIPSRADMRNPKIRLTVGIVNLKME